MNTAHSHRLRSLILATACLIAAAAGSAAESDSDAKESQIVTSGTADVTIPATTASFSVAISDRAATAAQASSESTRTAREVSRALKSAGLGDGEIEASRIAVGPVWAYDEKSRQQKRVGYEATSTIEIKTERLDRLGAYIDAALSAGATQVSDIAFSAKDVDEARRRALGEAVARARSDANVIARAGGGALGRLLLLTTEPTAQPRGIGFEEVAVAGVPRSGAALRPDIVPRKISVTARVVGHWAFVASPAPR